MHARFRFSLLRKIYSRFHEVVRLLMALLPSPTKAELNLVPLVASLVALLCCGAVCRFHLRLRRWIRGCDIRVLGIKSLISFEVLALLAAAPNPARQTSAFWKHANLFGFSDRPTLQKRALLHRLFPVVRVDLRASPFKFFMHQRHVCIHSREASRHHQLPPGLGPTTQSARRSRVFSCILARVGLP